MTSSGKCVWNNPSVKVETSAMVPVVSGSSITHTYISISSRLPFIIGFYAQPYVLISPAAPKPAVCFCPMPVNMQANISPICVYQFLVPVFLVPEICLRDVVWNKYSPHKEVIKVRSFVWARRKVKTGSDISITPRLQPDMNNLPRK